MVSDENSESTDVHLLLLWQVDLETNDITILNLILSEREFRLHQLNHSRFDFLEEQTKSG